MLAHSRNYRLQNNLDHCSSFNFHCTPAAAAAAAAAATTVVVTAADTSCYLFMSHMTSKFDCVRFHVQATFFSSFNCSFKLITNICSNKQQNIDFILASPKLSQNSLKLTPHNLIKSNQNKRFILLTVVLNLQHTKKNCSQKLHIFYIFIQFLHLFSSFFTIYFFFFGIVNHEYSHTHTRTRTQTQTSILTHLHTHLYFPSFCSSNV